MGSRNYYDIETIEHSEPAPPSGAGLALFTERYDVSSTSDASAAS